MTPQNDIKFRQLKHGLYIVSTPIGNLADITLRAIEVLKNSEYILCEDTRVSKKLLDKYEIRSKLISHHKNSHHYLYLDPKDLHFCCNYQDLH